MSAATAASGAEAFLRSPLVQWVRVSRRCSAQKAMFSNKMHKVTVTHSFVFFNLKYSQLRSMAETYSDAWKSEAAGRSIVLADLADGILLNEIMANV